MLEQMRNSPVADGLKTGWFRPLAASACAAVMLCVPWIDVAHAAGAVSLQPHEALYRMRLASAEYRSDVLVANGTMFYRFGATCDGWTVENRTVLNLTYEGGNDTQTAWTFASWEAEDGSSYRFRARYEQDGETLEKLSGSASLDDTHAGQAQFSEPDDRVIVLPEGTLFPTEHVRRLIEAGSADGGELRRVVFDGASIDNPYLVSAYFGHLSRAETDALTAAMGMDARPAWWVEMAFFPHYTNIELPEFEISAQYRDDGIADRIVQRFENFALDVSLTRLQALPPPKCERF